MKFAKKGVVLALGLVSFYGSANATVLTANVLSADVEVVTGFFGGTLLDFASTNVSNISFNGTARTAVYDSGTGLDFYYQFTNNANSANGLERFSAFDFSGLGATPVNVFQTGAGFGIFTNGTSRSDYADRTIAGVIGFNFLPSATSNKVLPGTTSFIQIIRTNGVGYKLGNFGIIDGIADNAKGFAPITAVPEPETYAMLIAGLALLGFISKRRKSI